MSCAVGTRHTVIAEALFALLFSVMRGLLLFPLVGVLAACGGADAPVDEDYHLDAKPLSSNDAAVVDEDATLVFDTAPPQKKGPPYPIVLAHGFFGFEDFAGAGFASYFYEVKDHLASKGETMVYTPAVDPFNGSEYRGKQLEAVVEKILADTGYAKVDIIGHSQGGLDARVVAHDHPDWVASVVTVGTPHDGVPWADIAAKIKPDSRFGEIVDALTRLVARPLYDSVGNETSMMKAIRQFTTGEMKTFNGLYTDGFGVKYFSIAGRTASNAGGSDCAAPDAPDFISAWNKTLDPVDPFLSVTQTLLAGFDGAPNDGMVRVRDAHWGTFLGCVPADHLDEMGHLFGDSPGVGNDWKYLDFYASLVKYLRDRGL